MIVAWDSFDGVDGDYPVYVMEGDPKEQRPSNGDRVMECYRMSLGWELQGAEYRANHWEWDMPATSVPEPKVRKYSAEDRVRLIGTDHSFPGAHGVVLRVLGEREEAVYSSAPGATRYYDYRVAVAADNRLHTAFFFEDELVASSNYEETS